jgi:tRNA-uridine 2-sulfurtransferase
MKQKTSKNKGKVVVAMSGGVDSSVAAALLKQQGYEVIGVFMQFWYPTADKSGDKAGQAYAENRCCSLESYNEAREVARLLDIPIYKVNFGKEFKKQIVDEFLAEYKAGHTPNPCVACNKFIKFDLLLKYAQTVFGADYLATGHYVKIKKAGSGYELSRPKDKAKDQTYFLYNLKQNQLQHLLFPLANYTKPQIRQLAQKLKLAVHAKPDSQEICFVGRSHLDFLKKYLKPKGGKIVDAKGQVLGEHQGLPLYTIGQRTGLGLSGGPWYVVDFNRAKNQLVVSRDSNDLKLLNHQIFFKFSNWLGGAPELPLSCQAQIRYHAKPLNCVVKKVGSKLVAEFKVSPQAAAAGQSIVFYDKDRLLGGGIII